MNRQDASNLSGYKNTALWRATLGMAAEAAHADALAILQGAYVTFRERAAMLTAQIGNSLPNLTIHDVTHLDALWETAALIAGNAYPLNPVEAFVFGGAILLHDAALCFEAYEGGQAGLRATVQWKDAYAAIAARHPDRSDGENNDEADFAAMRYLHSSRAAELANTAWSTPEGEPLYLIESHELRKDFGRLIGEIAASHHWPIEDLATRLPGQLNAPPRMPQEWRVDAVKIACLLRCADAAHIDSRRAPDFLRALSRQHGISAAHWTSQNWLLRADRDVADPEQTSLIFTSGRAFDEENAEAWWVAYDSVRLIDKELKAVAALLRSRPQAHISPPFAMTRVTGAASPTEASKFITTQGWQPQAVEIHVSNLEQLIVQLGGDKLYGPEQHLVVVLRELIQNARDSVVARRGIDPDHKGRIRVCLQSDASRHHISVTDDGVGMSHRVITGPLLDFGSSFWSSDLVRSEYPGLLSGGYTSVGKFGVGFYSVFMVASSVSVASRRFDAAADDVTQVRFPRGLSLRPLISTGRPAGFGYASTVVRLELDAEQGDPRHVLISKGREGYEPELRIPIKQALALICAGLDVTVELMIGDGAVEIAHRPIATITTAAERREWLFRLAGEAMSSETRAILEEHAERLRPVISDGAIVGLAALSTTRIRGRTELLTVQTVGGLATQISKSDLSRYVGYVDFKPNSAKRDASGEFEASEQALSGWASEQIALLKSGRVDVMGWCFATCSLADMRCDPIDIATMVIRDGENFAVYQLDQVVDLVCARGLAFYQSNLMDHVEMHHSAGAYGNMPTFAPITAGAFLSLDRDQSSLAYRRSAIACIKRRAHARGIEIEDYFIKDAAKSHFGHMHVRLLRQKIANPYFTVSFSPN